MRGSAPSFPAPCRRRGSRRNRRRTSTPASRGRGAGIRAARRRSRRGSAPGADRTRRRRRRSLRSRRCTGPRRSCRTEIAPNHGRRRRRAPGPATPHLRRSGSRAGTPSPFRWPRRPLSAPRGTSGPCASLPDLPRSTCRAIARDRSRSRTDGESRRPTAPRRRASAATCSPRSGRIRRATPWRRAPIPSAASPAGQLPTSATAER